MAESLVVVVEVAAKDVVVVGGWAGFPRLSISSAVRFFPPPRRGDEVGERVEDERCVLLFTVA